jgi:hypothetical protein
MLRADSVKERGKKMHKKQLLTIIGIALAFMLISCEKLEEPSLGTGGLIDYTSVAEEIPLEHGRFVSATTISPELVMLWFEQPDQTVIGVPVNILRGTYSETVLKIPRH